MKVDLGPGLFGSRTRTGVMLVLTLVDESHPSELAVLLETSVSNVLKAISGLERSGVISGVLVGRTRRVSLNPRFFAREELRALLDKLALSNPRLIELVSELRRRPRRAGKAINQVPKTRGAGFAKGKMEILGDIIEPLDVEWEALQ